MTPRVDLVQQIVEAYFSPYREQNDFRLAKAQRAAERMKVSWDAVKAAIDQRLEAQKPDA